MPKQSIYTKSTTETINNTPVTIQKTSQYEIPWTKDKSERPKDYFLQMTTKIIYEKNGQDFIITIPPVENEEVNRKRIITASMNGEEFEFNSGGKDTLNMAQTFDIPEMEKLIALATKNYANHQKACCPFIYMDAVNYEAPYDYNTMGLDKDAGLEETHGDIQKLLLPYIRAMAAEENKSHLQELYIPIVMPGKPHHWVVCVLKIDDNGQLNMAFLDSTPKAIDACSKRFNEQILPEINQVLTFCDYPAIKEDEVIYNISKQFSQKGCGIAASATIQKLMAQTEGSIDRKLLERHAEAPPPSGLSMEEDAIRRVELAVALTKNEKIINNIYKQELKELTALDKKSPLPKGQTRTLNEDPLRFKTLKAQLLRELKTDARTLTKAAKEAFQPKNP
ncbi:MAG: hypothetical protein QNK11_02595 [Legionella sp.]|nr:hypothetical protein [Legionella sp.]